MNTIFYEIIKYKAKGHSPRHKRIVRKIIRSQRQRIKNIQKVS
jgi:hypothetical protein